MTSCPVENWYGFQHVCYECDPTCLICHSGGLSDCTKCKSGERWLHTDGVCYETCPVGFWKDDNVLDPLHPICTSCNTIEPRCTECHESDGVTCTVCGEGFLH